MKKHIKKICFVILALMVVFAGCQKSSEPKNNETIERKDPKKEFGNFTPYAIKYYEDNNRVDIHFVETPMVFTLNLKEKNSHSYLEIVKSSIKSATPVLVSTYEGGMIGSKIEVATVERSSDAVIEKFKKGAHSPDSTPLSKESDIVPMPSEAVMNTVFNQCKNDPDQSFAFKPDGCYARAHKMMAIISQNGYMSGKQFVYGNLAVNIGNGCCQTWGWHVAPLIRFRNAANQIEVRIFDPSVSSTPLTKAQWEALITSSCTSGSGIALRFLARPEVYNRNPNTGQTTTDNNLTKTFCTLNLYKQYSGGCMALPPGACSW